MTSGQPLMLGNSRQEFGEFAPLTATERIGAHVSASNQLRVMFSEILGNFPNDCFAKPVPGANFRPYAVGGTARTNVI